MTVSVPAWARRAGIAVREPADYVVAPERTDRTVVLADRIADFDFRHNPCVDFGRTEERIPRCELQPFDRAQLVACIRYCAEHAIPYKVRGAGHSSGGQTLLDDGVVIDLRRLSRILDDHLADQTITVEGGTPWLTLIEHLIPQRRRPLTLIGNPWATVAGTLAVGGFGDTSHVHGLSIASVTELVVVTPDGTEHTVGPADGLFRFVLAGRGQLGVIAAATLRTMRRPATCVGRTLRWPSLAAFLPEARLVAAHRLYELFRPRLLWLPEHAEPIVEAFVGNFADSIPLADPARSFLSPSASAPMELVDLMPIYRSDSTTRWPLPCPALEVALPLPDGLALWPGIHERLVELDVIKYLPIGAAIMIVPRPPGLPLAPCPSDSNLMVVLRPELPPAEAQRVLPALRALGGDLLAQGARLYLMSVEPAVPEFLHLQFGPALAELRALKARLDPAHLCNPGLLA